MRPACFLPLLVAILLNSTATGFADGKVFARPDVQAKVEIPSQQALIHHRDGVECLVIETSFLGEGTNFAWVVPLPGEPKVRPVFESFFPSLQQAFQPRLLHYIHHYYLGGLWVCGVAFLGWRSIKDEAAWVTDLPLCLLMAAGVGLLGKSVAFGVLALAFTLVTRLFIRSTTNLTVVILVAMLSGVWLTAYSNLDRFHLIDYMGSESAPTNEPRPEVTVLSVQRAGVFDATTIRGTNPRAILEWLESNGFAAPLSIEPVVRDYVERGWVFVASKARREGMTGGVTALHSLAFTFATATPVYPMKLTGVENGDCAVDLYVFGQKRAAASHFDVVRCDRVAENLPAEPAQRWKSWLRIPDPDVLECIGNATVGTKLSARLTPAQMSTDAEITWRRFSPKAAVVYSAVGAATVALNVAVPLAALGWLLVGASRGGWGVDEKFVSRWRWRVVFGAVLVGGGVFWLLPKVAIITSQP
jgi:hypothetical protein